MQINIQDHQKTDLLIDMVALATATPRDAMRKPSRGEANIARARQIAMYLCHVTYGYSLAKVGVLFGRDKSTVGHAVRQVEDLRDEDVFETWMRDLETALEANARLCAQHPIPFMPKPDGRHQSAMLCLA